MRLLVLILYLLINFLCSPEIRGYTMKLIQVMDALDYGDGVSNDLINKNELFKEMGYETEVYSKWCHPKMESYWKDISNLKVHKDDILFHHFSGESHILDEILRCDCKKVLIYHNITPRSFFENTNKLDPGEVQLLSIYHHYNLIIAVSQFNVDSLVALGIEAQCEVVPILIDFNEICKFKKWSIKRNPDEKIFLFVGRIVENKKIEDIIDIFEEYYSGINSNSRLFFVGNYDNYKLYYDRLQRKVANLESNSAIIFTGKVDKGKLYNYFYNSDIFICMSEHEGFCIPLLESMSCGKPTMAYDACAISSTMGNAGILIKDKNPVICARVAHVILSDEHIKTNIIKHQNEWIKNFSRERIKKQLQGIIIKLLEE